MNITTFSSAIGFNNSTTISRIINGQTQKPGIDIFQNIKTKFPQTNLEWLITGHGNMFNESHPTQPLTNENETSDVMPRILKQLEQHNDYMRQLCNQFVKI